MRFRPALLFCTVLVGCAHGTGSTPPMPAAVTGDGVAADTTLQHALQQAPLPDAFSNFHYSFKGAPHDGSSPLDSLISAGDAVYGTTLTGGTNDRGTAYKISVSSGTETVLHSFGTGSDGFALTGRLLDVSGTLYGTTAAGGAHANGTIFELVPSGSSYRENVLYSFKGASDGSVPRGGLIEVGGRLYGTTTGGGASGLGTLFEVSTTGAESVLHSFGAFDSAGDADGATPNGNLVSMNGTLYGTTYTGGRAGGGTVFSFNPVTRVERVQETFNGTTEGSPSAGLVAVNGSLYGTTQTGGPSRSGTIFGLSPGARNETLYTFAGGSDGARPHATLLYANGLLYGTTDAGGNGNNGTVFKIDTSGRSKVVVHRFSGGIDGSSPEAGVIDVNGAIFGTTEYGGSGSESDDGTVYKLPS